MSPDIWTRLKNEISLAKDDTPKVDIYGLTVDHSQLGKFRPERISNAELAEVSSRTGPKQYMLRNPNENKYIPLGEEELFLWNLMDGHNTVKDIAIKYITQYDALGLEDIFSLVGQLKSNGFLQGKPAPVWQDLIARLRNHKVSGKIVAVLKFITQLSFTTRSADGFFRGLYRYFAWPLFTKPALVLMMLLLAGNLCFTVYYIFINPETDALLYPAAEGIWAYIAIMAIVNLSLICHECAHALTVKHYGRKVIKAGLMVYFGQVIAFVDTTDIWMRGRNPRMAVSFAGPATNAIIGGVFFLLAFFLPETLADKNILLHVAVINGITFIVNLLPIAETDGHYIIQDFFNMPHLRTDSLAFMRRGLWSKLFHRQPWVKTDYIYLAYGLVAVGGAVLLIFAAINLWFQLGAELFQIIADNPVLVGIIIGILIAFTTGVSILRHGIHYTWHKVRLMTVLNNRLKESQTR